MAYRVSKWLKYDVCDKCQAPAMQPCLDRRVQRAGKYAPEPVNIPHKGRPLRLNHL